MRQIHGCGWNSDLKHEIKKCSQNDIDNSQKEQKVIQRKGKLATSLHIPLSGWGQTKIWVATERVLLHDNALTH
jgi:hypothetical protein